MTAIACGLARWSLILLDTWHGITIPGVILTYVFLFVCRPSDWTQGLAHSGQVLYQWDILDPSPCSLGHCWASACQVNRGQHWKDIINDIIKTCSCPNSGAASYIPRWAKMKTNGMSLFSTILLWKTITVPQFLLLLLPPSQGWNLSRWRLPQFNAQESFGEGKNE